MDFEKEAGRQNGLARYALMISVTTDSEMWTIPDNDSIPSFLQIFFTLLYTESLLMFSKNACPSGVRSLMDIRFASRQISGISKFARVQYAK